MDTQIEQRLASLENQMAELRQFLPVKNSRSWLDQIAGSFQDDPDFDEILRLGRAIRDADRLTDEAE